MKAKSMKSLVSIVLVTLMLMPVFVGTASAEQESGSRYYIDLGEMNPRGEGYYLSFALPAGYEVIYKAVEDVEYGIKGGVCEIYPGHTMIKIVGSSDATNHIYSPKKREWGTYVQGPYCVAVHVYFYSRVCECDGTIEDYDEAIEVFSCGNLTYDETIEVSCGNLARYHGPIKYTRIHGHDACYWENPGEDRYMMYAYIFLEESHIGWDFLGTVGGLREPDYVTVDGQLLREKDRQVGNDLFSSIQISGPPPAEEESTYLCDNKLGVKAVELAEKVEGKGYYQGDTLSKGWNNGRFFDPQEIPYFDCSGLVYWSYNRAWEMITGNRIPHYSTWYENNNCVNEAPHTVFYLGASGQWKDSVRFEQISTEIPTVDDLKTGYLLFLDTNSNGLADHVGMYVGNGEVIHSKGGVGVERKPLNEWLDLSVAGGKYRDYFVGFGRVKQTSPLPTQPVTPTPSIETPQPEEPKQNPIQEVIEKIQENIPPIQTVVERIHDIIGKIRSLFGF